MTTNFPKRITEETARIRRIASTLPPSQRNTLMNAADRIELHSRRQAVRHLPTNMEMHDEIRDRANCSRRIVSAMLNGESVCYLDAARFGTAEFHSRICEARQLIEDRYPEYVFASEWRRGINCNYKVYYLESKV